jgi:hypothetical protein
MYSKFALENPLPNSFDNCAESTFSSFLPYIGPLSKLVGHLHGIDRGGDGVARGLDEAAQFGDEWGEFMRRGCDGLFLHRDKASCNKAFNSVDSLSAMPRKTKAFCILFFDHSYLYG